MKRLFPGAEWQVGALSVPISRGDAVVVSGGPRCLTNLLLLLRARLRGARTIWWGQLWSGTTRMHRFLVRLLLMRLADAVLFYTDAEVATYRARWAWRDKRPISALNNGIDVGPIKPLRRDYIASERGANVLFIGRLTAKAELDLLLRAMTDPVIAQATLHVIGDGADADAGALRRWADRNGLRGRVVWHGGTVDETRIAEVANRAAVFCYPGSVGLSLIHAMAYGLPALVHDDRPTHMPEIAAFEPGVTGSFFAKNDPAALARSLANLLANPDQRAEMSRQARERADGVFSTEAMAKRFVGLAEAVRC
jgi:glycosyltransferase involved in cell wall biosynthesis